MLYVTDDELAELLGLDPLDERLPVVTTTADTVVEHYYGTVTVNTLLRDVDGLPFPVELVPATVRLAALTIAADLWRRPETPGGYFQVADYVGRLAQDPTAPVIAALNALGRLEWPIA